MEPASPSAIRQHIAQQQERRERSRALLRDLLATAVAGFLCGAVMVLAAG